MTQSQRDRLWELRDKARDRFLDTAEFYYRDYVPSKYQQEYRLLEALELKEEKRQR